MSISKAIKVVVTGGAGFIGSHVVDELVCRGASVVVYDNLSTGFPEHIQSGIESGAVEFIKGDILETGKLSGVMSGAALVFHLAANADVRGGRENTEVDIRQNILGTHSVLEAMRRASCKHIVFTSSATVYGEPDFFPTPETYSPLQTSLYGASKLAAEGIIQAYGEYFQIRSHIFRFVSWIGERYSHGVVFDFVNKLLKSPHSLEILGDGFQKKSYLHVEDGIRGIFMALEGMKSVKNVINLGHGDYLDVRKLAQLVCEEMGLEDVEFRYTGGVRGWLGDSPFVHLDISKMRGCGFRPQISIEDGIRRTVRYLLENRWLLNSRTGCS